MFIIGQIGNIDKQKEESKNFLNSACDLKPLFTVYYFTVFDHLVNVVTASCFFFKGTLFYLQFPGNLWDTLVLLENPFFNNLSLNYFNIH